MEFMKTHLDLTRYPSLLKINYNIEISFYIWTFCLFHTYPFIVVFSTDCLFVAYNLQSLFTRPFVRWSQTLIVLYLVFCLSCFILSYRVIPPFVCWTHTLSKTTTTLWRWKYRSWLGDKHTNVAELNQSIGSSREISI